MQKELVLYYFPSCPYCQKVLNYLKDRDLMEEVELKNTREEADAKKELVSTGGKDQVPCLFIDGKPLYESDDIIEWFAENR